MHINIDEKSNCTGCYACENACPVQCIEMKTDEEGFWYPVVNNDKCINCEICIKSCPIINFTAVENTPLVYGGYSLNKKNLLESSSGGLFTELSSKVIELGGTVFGAVFDSKFNVVHLEITKTEDLKLMRGSKYVQSNIGASYKKAKEILENGKIVYFSGTPCQIEGLLHFLKRDYKNLICQDIICHGVPSPMIWDSYLKRFNLDKDAKISFRDKKISWERYSFTIDNYFSQQGIDNDYIKLFLNNYSLRPSCYKCHYKTITRRSDITLADFWGVKDSYPDLYNSKGTSLIFINSEKGKKLFNSVKENIKYEKVELKKIINKNSTISKSAYLPNNRGDFFKEINDKNFRKVTNKYVHIPWKLKFKRKLKRLFIRNN
ncbi:Coenzyme F420 hydrogenase/dehydrogenase, beta subunit C-terminal domain [Thomasclavelia spiroformis]|uniref:Coenzyme F420 hydrogenase/dehydrogenase, beta subunit C-terminal domain n=1 Tax=Thomasclavelia spiroformis TaxID=29348 RepID=UPI0026F35B0F|nr:Coenzyme F420 hydrogenase/dehydrogenase, beta subunit C-terminal domain [Thomasclavelia spiroformis]